MEGNEDEGEVGPVLENRIYDEQGLKDPFLPHIKKEGFIISQ